MMAYYCFTHIRSDWSVVGLRTPFKSVEVAQYGQQTWLEQKNLSALFEKCSQTWPEEIQKELRAKQKL